MSLRHWWFRVIEWLDAWAHIHVCNYYERLLDKEIAAGRHAPVEDDEPSDLDRPCPLCGAPPTVMCIGRLNIPHVERMKRV